MDSEVTNAVGPRIAIAGYYGFGNMGDEAVLCSMLADLRREVPGAHFVILRDDYADTVKGDDISYLPWHDWQSVLDCISRSNLMIVGGGGLFNCYLEYDPSNLLRSSRNFGAYIYGVLLAARLLRVPSCVFGAGASRFLSDQPLYHARMAIRFADAVTLRDSYTERILRGGPAKGVNLRVTADPAFRLENAGIPPAVSARIFPREQSARPLIGVVLRNWFANADTGDWEGSLARALSLFSEQTGARVAFLPFQASSDTENDLSNDTTAIRRMLPHLCGIPVEELQPGLTGPEMSALIARCDLLLAMRLHGSILAIKNAVPFLALLYDPKVDGMLQHCGLAHLGIEMHQASDQGWLERRLQKAWAERERTRDKLGRVASRMREAALENVRMVGALLRQPVPGALEPDRDVQSFLGTLAVNQTIALAKTEAALHSASAEVAAWRQAIRTLIGKGHFEAGLDLLNSIVPAPEFESEWRYHSAYCLHCAGRDSELALEHYAAALASGFDEFWVRFHRGQLLIRLGRSQEALIDLRRAKELRPGHSNLPQLISSLISA